MGELRVEGLQVGSVSEYDYRKAEAELHLDLPLAVGDRIHFVGVYTDFIQLVERMSRGGRSVRRGRAAQKVRVAVKYHVRIGDAVVLLPPRSGEADGPEGGGLGLWGRRRI